jgi:uncharacterized BrkB/YihY/UPF0761 family membrane protein
VPLVLSFIAAYGPLHTSGMLSQIAVYGTGLVLIFVVTMGLYTYLPNRRVGLRFGIPGASALYSIHVNFRHVYGALGAFALLPIWLYYMATIFLFGAELCAQSAAAKRPC